MITLKNCAQMLLSEWVGNQNLSYQGVSIDSRNIKPGQLFVAIKGERFDGHDFVLEAERNGAAAVLVNRAVEVKIPCIIVADTTKALGELARWYRQQFKVPVIAVTGSCGKTTTKVMLASIFSGLGKTLSPVSSFNNEIGMPLTLLQLDDSYRTVILEIGTNHPGEIAHLVSIAQPTVAAVTLVAPVHLEGFGSLENIAHEKGSIFGGVAADGVAVVNIDDPMTKLWQQNLNGKRVIRFGRQISAEVSVKNVVINREGCAAFTLVSPQGEISISLPVVGEHNIINALAASACAIACDVSLVDIKAGLENMPAVAKRMVRHELTTGAVLIDDTYNANPQAFKAALSVLRHAGMPTALVMGDMGELGPESEKIHYEVGGWVQEAGIDHFFTLGTLSAHAAAGYGDAAQHFTDPLALIAALRPILKEQKIMLVKGSRSMRMENIVEALLDQRG